MGWWTGWKMGTVLTYMQVVYGSGDILSRRGRFSRLRKWCTVAGIL